MAILSGFSGGNKENFTKERKLESCARFCWRLAFEGRSPLKLDKLRKPEKGEGQFERHRAEKGRRGREALL